MNRGIVQGGLLLLAVLLAHGISLSGPFIWDDHDLIVNNRYVQSWAHFFDLFRLSPFGYDLSVDRYWRPLQAISFLADHSVWGLRPFGFHLTNLLLHASNTVLLWRVLGHMLPSAAGSARPVGGLTAGGGGTRSGDRGRLSLWIAAVFAVHPITTEAVAFIAIRGDLLVFFFTISSFYAFLLGREGKRFGYACAVLSLAVALLAKESAVVGFFMLGIFAVLVPGPSERRRQERTALVLLGLVVLVYLAVRALQFNESAAAPLSRVAEASPWHRFLTFLRAIVTAIRLLLVPHPLHMEYHFVETGLSSPYIWLGVPLAAIVLLALVELSRGGRLSLFFLAWFLVGLAPFNQVFLPLPQSFAERWVYQPAVGFLALAGLSIHRWFGPWLLGRARVAAVAGFVFFAVLISLSAQRDYQWTDAERLYQHDLALEPHSFLLHHNLGVLDLIRGDLPLARSRFERALQEAPGKGYATAHNSLGLTLELEGDFGGAEEQYRRAIGRGWHHLAYANLGRVLVRQGRPEEATQVLLDGIRRYPTSAGAYYYLGAAYEAMGDFGAARGAWVQVQALDPGYRDVAARLAQLPGGQDGAR